MMENDEVTDDGGLNETAEGLGSQSAQPSSRKAGRNGRCPSGSGKNFETCCLGNSTGRVGLARFASPLANRLAEIDVYDLAAAALFGALFILVLATFGSYGISNDEEVQQRYGELILAYYGSGFADQSVFHFKDLYLYGGLFDLIAVGLEKLLPFDIYATRHLLSGLIGVGGIAAAWAAARNIAGPRAGLLAAAALATCGTWYGAMFNHTKDIPFAAAMMGATYLLLRIAVELPRPPRRLVLVFGVLCGCALGIRVLGVFVIADAAIAVLLYAPFRRGGLRLASAFAARSALNLAAAFALAYAIMVASWPWSALAPLNPVRALVTFIDLHYPIYTILAGHIYRMNDVPRWYVPTYLAIKLTLPLLIGAGLGLVMTAWPGRTMSQAASAARKPITIIVAAAVLPLLSDAAVGGPDFTGLRHFLFIVPPLAVLAGIGLNAMLGQLARSHRFAVVAGAVLLTAWLGWDADIMYRLHPDEYIYFNPVVGGLAGASRRYAMDYWVNIMPEAVADLEHYLDQSQPVAARAGGKHRYLVSVCGERIAFEDRADARLQWIGDPAHADFFIAPTHMNCDRAIPGRIVARVERLGVMIGVVKDLRETHHQTLAHAVIAAGPTAR